MLCFCLRHVRRALEKAALVDRSTVAIVDNASEFPYDPAVWEARGGRVIRFDAHQTFARANNEAFRRFPNSNVLLLNNDVLLHEDTIAAMLQLLESAGGAGICGSRLLFPDGTIQHVGVMFGAGDQGPYHRVRKCASHLAPRVDSDFQAVTGACLLASRPVWEELGGLCEDYEFGLEDIDFCLRARQRGWRVLCSQSTESLHFESLTPGRVKLDVASRRLFMKRWKGKYAIDG